jgi:hypothetical protein
VPARDGVRVAPVAPAGETAIPPSAAFRPLAWLLMAVAIIETQADPDLWGHVRFGEDILRTRSLPVVDPYSFTQDVPWVNHEWLSELFMGGAFAVAGPAGLMLLKGALAGAALLLMFGALRQCSFGWRWAAMAAGAFAVLPLTLTLRPQLWTLLLLLGLCRLLVHGGRGVWAIPVLFIVWANAHGGWVLGLGVLGAWIAGRFVEAPAAERRTWLAVAALSAAATLLTPYGWELWQFIATTVRLSRADISEWQPIWRDSTLSVLLWASAAASAAVCWWRFGRPPLSTLMVLGLLAFASARVNRIVPLFVAAAVMLLAQQFPAAGTQRPAGRARTTLELALVCVALLLGVRLEAVSGCISIKGGHAPDVSALAALVEAKPAGRMVTFFDWGEAALAHLSPGIRVSVDGRRETVYSSRTLQEQFDIAAGRPAGLDALARLAPDYVWLPLPHSERTAAWLVEHGYRIDVETPRSFIAVRGDHPVVLPAAAVPTMCFPGP